MCTLSFIPRSSGAYVVAMNRDELFTRGRALGPRVHEASGRKALFPEDPNGGTWIAVNEAGITLAILNWSTPQQGEKLRSRGEVIPGAVSAGSLEEVRERMAKGDFAGMRPFRLVGIAEAERSVREWRWDGERVTELEFAWERRHWFSSGLSDEEAAVVRGNVLAGEGAPATGEEFGWLRRMHASHVPEKGAFSMCVHRDDAATQSYTEIEVGGGAVRLRYRDGAPCIREEFDAEIVMKKPAKTGEIRSAAL